MIFLDVMFNHWVSAYTRSKTKRNEKKKKNKRNHTPQQRQYREKRSVYTRFNYIKLYIWPSCGRNCRRLSKPLNLSVGAIPKPANKNSNFMPYAKTAIRSREPSIFYPLYCLLLLQLRRHLELRQGKYA